MRSAINLVAKAFRSKRAKGFDATFYLSHYEDLSSLRSRKQALRHYLEHGESEGRFANEAAYLQHVRSLHDGFDLAAYKFYNKDLAHRFGSEEEFLRHFVRHGHAEGRLFRFSEETHSGEPLADADKWRSIFSTSEFLAWCGEDIVPLPTTREQAIAIFLERGIANLWPINLEYAFDPGFVRGSDLLPAHRNASDADLYRAWLEEGFPAGIAPNERVFLSPYLGGAPFPSSLDCEALGRKLRMRSGAAHSQVLMALFDATAEEIVRLVGLMGEEAPRLLDRIGQRAMAAADFAKAEAVFAHRVSKAATPAALAFLGDARRAMGANGPALEAYRAAIAMEHAPIGAFLHAATILASQQSFSEAFVVLRKAHGPWRQTREFARKLEEIVQLHFDHYSARAHAGYQAIGGADDPTARKVVDDLLTGALDEIRDIYLELDRLPAAVGGDPVGYVAILANDDLRQCTHYRIEQKALEFESAGIPVRVFSHADVEGFVDSLIGARAAIFYRVGAVPAVLRAILHANTMGLDTWYEVDDLIFDSNHYPDPLPSFEGQISAREYAGLQFGVPLFRYALSLCGSAIASTPALLERMEQVVANGYGIVLRNGLDARNATSVRMGARPTRGDRVRIFYGSGTKAHNADFNRLVAPALAELMERYPQLDLVIVGHLQLTPALGGFGERIHTYPFISDVMTYWSVLASCDINIAVLEPGAVADCKSEIKWLEAAVLQVCSVVSGTGTYREVIEDGVDGLLADTPLQWRERFEQLVNQPSRREELGRQARIKALRDYDLAVGAAALQRAFGTVTRMIEPARHDRLRVLICNVFYAPQSYGGATRVVEDNVREFAASYPDLDIAVCCVDEDATPPGMLRLNEENGVPVYRLATAREARMNWRPFDDRHADPFERVLDHFKPDLIHFHCIQRLTATIVEVALARGIPYVVTVHDAWWISDDQFLVDEDGLLHLPGRDVSADSLTTRDPPVSLARRLRLSSLLNHAKANLSVSASFAEIYANAGVDRLQVVENGVSPIGTVARSLRPDGRIALGHVGGKTLHKGAALLEAVLKRGNYPNLHLTMIDGSLAVGEQIDTIWGTTAVTLTGPYPQGQVAQLYGRLEVVVVPSIWPESYGLVVREAIAAQLWVIASNLGALAEAILDGLTGDVIDVATAEGLATALSAIDADPEGHRARAAAGAALASRHGLRTTAHQADELHALYHEVLAASSTRQA